MDASLTRQPQEQGCVVTVRFPTGKNMSISIPHFSSQHDSATGIHIPIENKFGVDFI